VSAVDHSEADRLSARIAKLEDKLREANETLDAIRHGEVDAVVVGSATKQVIYTLENADRPYRTLVEQMQEGALTLNGGGIILYCNQSFASLIGKQIGHLIGHRFQDNIREQTRIASMLADPQTPCGDLRSRMRSSATMQYCSNRRGVSSCPKTNPS
jgi:PAS domain-containing protein